MDSLVLLGSVAPTLIHHAAEEGFDLIAMSTHGRSGLSKFFYGSVAEELLRASPVPLLLVRPDFEPTRFRRILVPLDGSKRAESILSLATGFAKASGGELLIVTVLPAPQPERVTWHKVQESRGKVEAAGVPAKIVVRYGDPLKEILRVGQMREVDLIALSTHGRTGMERFRFGSVAEEILKKSKIPLLVQRTVGVLPRYQGGVRSKYKALRRLAEKVEKL